ncbi:MAG: DNA polymerase II large subunit, partial [Candidatus Thermoplasmatota archaeon]|nr:DNA polymerase II large subunit [Candidatus Thermoplasmatota archaeon]
NNVSSLEWIDAAPCRIGCRMGRPEKSAPREMKQKAHALYPIQNYGGPQRLLATAVSREGSIRVTVGPRRCLRCDRETPHIRCHHRTIPNEPQECGGRTVPADRRGGHLRNRMGELTTIPLADILEVKRISLGLDRLPERIKAMKGLTSKAQYPEPIEKGILRAIHDVSAFRDGTIRYDMIDVPVTHFRPIEIGTSVEKLVDLGYTHDIRGDELKEDTQILELFPQDFIPSRDGGEHLLKISQYLDDLLVRFYKMKPEFNAETIDDLVGQLGIALAPHTSGGVLCRFIGWTNASAGYGHTLFHAAKRRNCDGDEDCVMLLLDGLLNFSRMILPSSRGGRMDAPLTLTTRLNPMELDKEALHVDAGWNYSKEFYLETLHSPHPRQIMDRKLVDLVNNRIGTVGAVRGYGFSHDLESLDAGPVNSAYKTLGSMTDKMSAQLALGRKLRSVDARIVASTVIGSHLLPDVRGNLNAFSRQKVRCAKCNHSYRRLPLAGKCIQMQGASGGLHGHHSSRMEESRCGGNLILTVSQGAVRKYLGVINHVIDNFGIDPYTQQYVDWMADSVESVFQNDKVTVYTLDDFL